VGLFAFVFGWRILMAKPPVPLTTLSEEQRAQAYARYELLRPVLEEGVSQA
jgi:hypothetical protein